MSSHHVQSMCSHHVHGLAANEISPDWPPLALADLESLFRQYPALGAPLELLWHSPRPLSAAAIVRSERGPVFVKRHHQQVRNCADLGEEHKFIRHLQARGIVIPTLIANQDQQTATTEACWSYELSELAPGQDLYRDSRSWEPIRQLAHARSAGQALARLHLAAADYQAPQRRTHLLLARGELIASRQPLQTLQQQLPLRPGLQAYLQPRPWQHELAAILAPWHGDLPRRLAATPPLWTHNDWHASNLTWQLEDGQARVCSVLDFGLSARTWAVYDLATAIERNTIAWLALEQGLAAARTDIAIELLDGYSEVSSLSRATRQLVRDLLPIVHIDFALSEVEYFHAITGSDADADVAYHTFLAGHAAWFASSAGQHLLRALAC